MDVDGLARRWALRFGLAQSPLFEAHEAGVAGRHDVLMDGGYGSFALSESESRIWTDEVPAEWSWSSNLPHHVTVTSREVAVVRWDREGEELFTRKSIEQRLDSFYEFLVNDQVQSNRRVVDYLVAVFRRVRNLVAEADMDDSQSVDAYIGILARAMARRGEERLHATATATKDVLAGLAEAKVERVLSYLADPWMAGRPPLRLHPMLAVRHAGSEVFQEAHFELVRSSGTDLLGDSVPAESNRTTRGGAHFTPPALARSLVERALLEMHDLHDRYELTVLDPACGSGVFLHEVLRTLRRVAYKGTVRLVGWDNSPPAVSMARFVLENACADWQPEGGSYVEVTTVDSLAVPFPPADLIVMNPPFLSWPALTSVQREQVAEILGGRPRGRPDMSMAFLAKAVRALKPNGAVGSLMPASLLTSEAAQAWRNELLDQADLAFLGSLGDYGLFIHAMVQVAATVLTKPSPAARRSTAVALLSANNRLATGNALRELRKAEPDASQQDAGWHIFPIDVRRLRQRPTWRLVPPHAERVLTELLNSRSVLRVDNLFDVRQGVLTGLNAVFLLTRGERNALPESEWPWFREAVTSNSIVDGRIESSAFVFYPYGPAGLELQSQDELEAAVPEYYRLHLRTNRERLASRPGHLRAEGEDWWGLTRPRAWERASKPRIATKYFGERGGFALDAKARYIIVQGYGWIPKEDIEVATQGAGEATVGLQSDDYLSAYTALLNSSLFQRLLGIYSPQVAGGQFNLSPRFVRHVPLPDLSVSRTDDELAEMVWQLARLGRGEERLTAPSLAAIDELAGRLYGVDWPGELP